MRINDNTETVRGVALTEELLRALHCVDTAEQQLAMHAYPAVRRMLESRRDRAAVEACRELLALMQRAADSSRDSRQIDMFN